MSYGFKFLNNNSQLVIDDRNVKPWLITGPYIGANFATVEINTVTDFRFKNFNDFPPLRSGAEEVWRLYEIFYVAPSTVNCFAVFTLPDVGGGLWYTNGVAGSVVTSTFRAMYNVPLAGSASYPATSIVVAVPQSWLLTATEAQLIASVPKVYYYAADAIPANSKGTGYGAQVFKEDASCVFDTDKKHIQPGAYSFGYVQTPPFPASYTSTDNGGTVIGTPISGFTGNVDNLAFSLPSSTFVKMEDPPPGSAVDPNMVQGWFSNIFYNRTGGTLYTANVIIANNIWDKDDNESLPSGSIHVTGTESVLGLDAANPTNPTYYSRVLALDTTGYDSPYTPQQFPSSYVVTALSNFDTVADGEQVSVVNERNYPIINNLNPYTMIRFKVAAYNVPDSSLPYTISGTNITTDDIQLIYKDGGWATVSLTGNITISGGIGVVDVFLKEDGIIEGTETITFSLNGGKGSVSVTVKEVKTYGTATILEANTVNGAKWVGENQTCTIELVTYNVPVGTVIPYMLLPVTGTFNASDIVSGSLTGNLTVVGIGSNAGAAKGTFQIKADSITEATQESFSVSALLPGNSSYTVIIPQVFIEDTSRTPTASYSIRWYNSTYGYYQTGGYATVTEGTTMTFDIVTVAVPDGTRVYPSIDGLYNNTSVADYIVPNAWYDPNATPSPMLGVVINNNFAQFSLTIKNDLLTEGNEVFVPFISRVNDPLTARSNSLASWFDGWITITDTSVGNETYTAVANKTYLTEPTTLQIDFGVSVATPTNLVWVISGISMEDIESMYYINADNSIQTFSNTPAAVFVFDSTKKKTLAIKILADALVEGTENLRVELHTSSYDGPLKAFVELPVYDTSGPTYTITPNATTVNEGTTVRFNVTANVPDGNHLYWTNIGTSTSSDFVDGNNSGGVLIMSNAGWFDRAIRNDALTENGSETMQMTLKLGSDSGPTVAASSIVTINDSSKTVTASVVPTVTSVNEGGVVRWNLTTTGIPNGTYIYWTNVGTTTAADFDDVYVNTNYGSVLIMDNAGWFARQLKSDFTTEGSETIIMRILTGGNFTDGVLLTTSSTVTVSDTSVPVNEQMSVSPTTVTFPSGTALTLSGGVASDTVNWSINNQSYDGIFYLDASGNAYNATAGSGFAPGTYTLYVKFLATGHTRQVSWTVQEVNEITTVSPSSVVYPNPTNLSITKGRPNDTIYFSVNSTAYDQATPLNASGELIGPIGANYAAGTYTLYMKFQGSNHYRQVTWTVTAANPAAGTLLSYYCTGVNRYANYANGSGGSYSQLYQANSPSCGYVAPAALVVNNFSTTSNDEGNIDLWGSPSATYDGVRCKGAGRDSIDMYITRTFTCSRACTLQIYLHVSSEASCDYGYVYVDSSLKASGSGTYESGAINVALTSGTHTIMTRYTKDGSVSTGTDTVFVECYFS